tara:strand:+ start:107 stop:265 length:159 start_codon:yes stop_codon:yes gene_type:complete
MHRESYRCSRQHQCKKLTRAIQNTPPESWVDKIRSQSLLVVAKCLPMYMDPL